jgi:hypothetical protein
LATATPSTHEPAAQILHTTARIGMPNRVGRIVLERSTRRFA